MVWERAKKNNHFEGKKPAQDRPLCGDTTKAHRDLSDLLLAL
jgi:hypothetical protein